MLRPYRGAAQIDRMVPVRDIDLARRRLIGGSLALAALGALPGTVAAEALRPTAAQSRGPFYPRNLPLEQDADLARVAGAPGPAQGRIVHLFGRLRDESGRQVAGARVEIWQCNAFGRYHHPGDTSAQPLDPGFQGYGRAAADAQGAYRFRTIKPVAYGSRAPHIHFAVTPPGAGRSFITQMYVAGEAANERDFLLNGVRDPESRAALIVALGSGEAIEPGTLAANFDIVLARSAFGRA